MARMARLTAATALTPQGDVDVACCGGSLDGGREEFREVWFSCSCNVQTCSCKAWTMDVKVSTRASSARI